MVADLTGLDISNASLLDESTAAAEAMTLARRSAKSKSPVFFISRHVHPQTIEVVRTRAEGLDIEIAVGDEAEGLPECFGVLLQYPHSTGSVADYRKLADAAHAQGAVVAVATDLLALAVLAAPGEGAPTSPWARPSVSACRSVSAARMPASWPARTPTSATWPAAWSACPRRAGQSGHAPGAANARAAHPPREGHLQHLHRAGAAGGDGRHVRRLARPGRHPPHRQPRQPLHRDPARRAGQAGREGRQRQLLRHAAAGNRRGHARHPDRGRLRPRQPAPRRRRAPGRLAGRDRHRRRPAGPGQRVRLRPGTR